MNNIQYLCNMIAINNKITHWTPNSKNTQYELVFEENPHIKSRASYLLLIQEYRGLDLESDPNTELQRYFEFRAQFLSNRLQLDGDLVCKYCGQKHLVIGYTSLKDSYLNNNIKNLATLDHIVPLSAGGEKYDPNNINVSCKKCNKLKGDMSLDEFTKKISLLNHHKKQLV